MEELGRDLVARMLSKGEIGAGPTEQPHAMLPVVDHVVQMLTPTMPRDVALRVEAGAASADMAVRMTPIEMQQVVLQVVLNAREAQGEQPGVVAITIDQCCSEGLACERCDRAICGSHVRLQVRDHGTGMDADTLARAFEPFFTTKTARRHAGLGLNIVQALTDKAGGQVRLHSTPERGTVCEILLPHAVAARAEPVDIAPGPGTDPVDAPAALCTRGRRVWLVTANLPTGLYLADQLQSHGLEVRRFSDAAPCLEALRAQPDALDVLLIDNDLPQMAAPALIRRARALRPDLLCVLCTAPDQSSGHASEAREAGAQVVLPKPFVLLDLLRAVLARHDDQGPSTPVEASVRRPESTG